MERKEITVYAMTVDDSRSVPIKAIQNSDGSYSLTVAGSDSSGAIATTPQPVSFNDHSGTIGQASVAQNLMPANTARKSLYIQNLSSDDLYIRFGGGAATESVGSGKLLADGSFEMECSAINQSVISIIGPTIGQEYTAWEGI